jgi:benzoyl-CoA reductase/2-hydroxyglutaryl-CoA dehydratase subunit BcrC/BadD/HgdB
MGGVVVADESCAGDRYLYDPVGSTERTINDQMLGIASRYLAPCVCPSFSPNDDRLTLIQRMITDFAVDGVLYHVLKGCVVYDFEVNRVENALRENQIPLLRVETDYNPEDVEQLRTRIEAFIEMLKSKRNRLKQAAS